MTAIIRPRPVRIATTTASVAIVNGTPPKKYRMTVGKLEDLTGDEGEQSEQRDAEGDAGQHVALAIRDP